MDAQTARQKLLEEQESLAALRQQSEQARAPVMLDQQAVGRLSRMDAMQKQNMELATEQHRQQHMQTLAAALLRIEAGDFGYCTLCGEEIAPQRLAFDPAVACCIQCRT